MTSAAALAFYAFLGFEDVVNSAEAVRGVRRTMPLGIAATLLITAIPNCAIARIVVLAVPVVGFVLTCARVALDVAQRVAR